MGVKKLESIESLYQFIGQKGAHLLFKHSTACPISAAAYKEFSAFTEEMKDSSAAIVYVIEDRAVSNQVADHFGIKHESPQIFLLQDGNVVWHTSHWKITQQSIREAFANE